MCANQTIPVLYQELLEHIVSFNHDDIHTLRACSLVAHSFLPSSQSYIFHEVALVRSDVKNSKTFDPLNGRVYTCPRFLSLLETSPHISSFVKILRLYDDQHTRNSTEPVEQLPWTNDDSDMEPYLPHIFGRLGQVQQITISCFPVEETSWHVAYPAVATALSKMLSMQSVSKVEMDPLQYLDAAELVSLLRRENSHIRHLTIDFPLFYLDEPPTYAVNSHVGEIPGLPLIELESLRLTSWAGDMSPYLIRPFLGKHSPFDLSTIRHLSLQFHWIDSDDILQIQKAVNQIGETFEHLTIYVGTWNRRHDAPLDVSRNSRLSCVDIVTYVFPVEGWYKQFPFKSTVKHMRFDIQYRERDEENVDWAKLDEYLNDEKKSQSLQSVEILVHSCQESHCSWPFICSACSLGRLNRAERIRTQMLRLQHRGILQVKEQHSREIRGGFYEPNP
ncbi:uncharacterized protein ARMOST_15449 [Armillaria ostoyae]|uniref:F-box domain-containing protein n=1 Tax=Armillaria ostoyae TaxID=47428 RepID=A0A284RTG4_ARMOS|nr:uncharacterized protein ARMOST_15449 [Armillaria ostoyae]